MHHSQRVYAYAILLSLLVGIGLRVYPSASFDGLGFDENLYATYTAQLNASGLGGFGGMVDEYIVTQKQLPSAILPPTRFLYVFLAHIWCGISDARPINALHDISCLFSIMTLCLSALFSWRLGGVSVCAVVTALMACAPTQIHMSQHALVDGFFAFWALLCLYLLWESFQRCGRRQIPWLLGLGCSLAFLVMTKENSFFVFVGFLCIVALAPKFGYGRWSLGLLLALLGGPTLGVVSLVLLAGGPSAFVETYSLLVEKAYQLEYAIKTGDGPWFRYLVDLMLVSPLVLILAVGAAFRIDRLGKPAVFLLVFLVSTYLIMCNIKYGMNLRYTNMWDMPLRYLAASQILFLASLSGSRRALLEIVILLVVCVHQIWLYHTLFVKLPLYELVTGGLLHALRILK